MSMKRVLCILLILAVVCIVSLPAAALDYGCNVETRSGAVYLENLDTGAVILDKNADQKMYPASTTKIMTYVVVADSISDFDGTKVPIKQEVFAGIDPESTVMGLSDHVGEECSIRDLLYGMMLPSGNDAALVLADYVGNGISGFVEKMNAKAAELGCTNTHFENPHGLYDANHYTTAKDLAKIAKYAATTQSFMEITNTVSYTPAGFSRPLHNTNYMLDSNEQGGKYYRSYVKGIKTGFLDEAGKCLVTTAEKDGSRYLCVALGAPYTYEEDVNYAMLDSADLYDWAFENIAMQTVYGSAEVVKTVDVSGAKGDEKLNLIPESELSALLPKNYDKNLIKVEVDCGDSVDAPVQQGQVLGTATVHYDDLVVGTTNIVASKSVEAAPIAELTRNVGNWFSSHLVVIILVAVIFVALIVALIAISSAQKKKARERARHRRYRD